ncbi:MAG: phosphatidate cytidylyltransferase [Chiayiivirga sp.]|jgi:phosphatidate cytidylyltransferase|uniref:Phosphatidate cytidylyltransferase n=1 Tax=Denitratimonas tolerans TaxID=1338420 RepID=A0AAW9R7F6_9GAMM|nr:phosphatidate cytidylyltransferase [Xanthomonadaceae bacterium]MDX9763394.1 phosphatidate cytidylyltransferase [Chiayiivirga sp.]MEB2314893.1 phosphatidate cytidylyltransferase [Xanthomonadaceae bacterium]HRO87547.1 phosphatidate cytidylyltransferase [Chiayiivirga sp.]HRQ34217.1 phosphatidate cytidylyltransferase [Chiayiivirga sp.]
MRQRVITALVLAPAVVAGILLLPPGPLMALVAAALLAGLWEWTRLIGFTAPVARALILLAHAAAMAWLARFGWSALFPWVALAGTLWWLCALAWLRQPTLAKAATPGNRALKLMIGTLLVVPTWCAFALLHADAPIWALYALLLVWAADTFAFFAGRRFGGRKLAPAISPGKTWAGFWGGLFGVLVLALAMAPLLSVSLRELPLLLAVSLIASLASVLGDLFESVIKRQAGVKDSGRLLPGHGGALDRIDSLLAALPVLAILKAWFGL